jgi:putative ATP-dependent endonuclease of the OLD family
MHLETVAVHRFRSIDAVVLDDCGSFNVVIGKNNSGKSNLLLAISAFFGCLRDGIPISITPPMGGKIDFHNKDHSNPISVALTFRLTLAERDGILQDIVAEAPQVKNAVEGLDPELRLRVTVAVAQNPGLYAYVQRIELCPRGAAPNRPTPGRTILEINAEAASELADKARRAQVREREAKYIVDFLESLPPLDADDWKRFRADVPSRLRPRYYTRGLANAPTTEIHQKIDDLISSSDTVSGFREAAQALGVSLQEEATDLKTNPLAARLNSFAGQETLVPAYAMQIMSRLADMKVLYLTERRDPIGRTEAAKLLELKVRRGGPEKLRNIRETVTALLGVDIDAFRAEGTQSGSEPAAELDVDNFLVQVNGAGIREALRLILDYEFEHPDLLLVEEPEIHLHPALETSMMRYLRGIGEECQIFVTTHSTNFLDAGEMHNVYLASKQESTRVELVNVEEAAASIPRELGIRLSSLFMFDRLVFVEGPSDEEVVREWASILGINLAQAGVGFVSMGGVRNLGYFAAKGTLDFLTRRRVRIWFLIDRDEREAEDVKDLSARLTGQAKLVVLERREIENYLIVPRALHEFIRLKREMAAAKGDHPSLDQVVSALDAAAEELKQIAIERRVTKQTCFPIYSDQAALRNQSSGLNLKHRIIEDLERRRALIAAVENDLDQVLAEQTEIVEPRLFTPHGIQGR